MAARFLGQEGPSTPWPHKSPWGWHETESKIKTVSKKTIVNDNVNISGSPCTNILIGCQFWHQAPWEFPSCEFCPGVCSFANISFGVTDFTWSERCYTSQGKDDFTASLLKHQEKGNLPSQERKQGGSAWKGEKMAQWEGRERGDKINKNMARREKGKERLVVRKSLDLSPEIGNQEAQSMRVGQITLGS